MHPWLVDSGANAHVAHDLGQLTNPRDYHGGDRVNGVLGGTYLEIAKVGTSLGPSKNGLYGLYPIGSSKHKHGALVVLLGVRVNGALWHSRLGHLSSFIFQHLVS
ncbi:unnamed protein product [Prunus armeniaca]